MTVQELINELLKVENKDLKVIIKGTDNTDFDYFNEVKSCKVKKVELENDEDDFERVKCFVIDGGDF